ncbi:MAG: alpha/beta fold hydrolase [Polyangiaceae bacterium]|nr:alpha/beta fold hydrolase [Polyangiaceae bacterium]
MSGRQWRKLAESLASSHRVLVPDLIGSGDNPAFDDAEPFHFHQDVKAVRELVTSVGGPAHVVGHSYGGLVALTLAREAPSLVRSIAVYDPVAFGVLSATLDEGGLADLARAGENPVFTDEARGGGEAWFEAFVDYWNGAGAWRALPEASRAAFLRVGRKVFREVTSLMADNTPPSAYANITAPALLLGGERSPLAARRVGEILASALPHATKELVAGAGHMGPITHAAQVNTRITEHIAAADAT